ncbi:MAG: ORF6N domain-containing protein [bacterium]
MGKDIIPQDVIEQKIFLIRGHKVMIDSDLAELYGVTTKRLNEQVKRNLKRFPRDFMFQLSEKELESLRSHFATSSSWGGRRYPPYAFTEHGAIMAASILNTNRAIEVSVYVVRAFVKLREMIASHKDLARKLEELEKKYDAQFRVVFDAIRELMREPERGQQKKIGFIAKEGRPKYKAERPR